MSPAALAGLPDSDVLAAIDTKLIVSDGCEKNAAMSAYPTKQCAAAALEERKLGRLCKSAVVGATEYQNALK